MLLFTKLVFPFVEKKCLDEGSNNTTICRDSHLKQQVCIPLEAQGKDVNFLYPELCVCVCELQTTWPSAAEVTCSSLECPKNDIREHKQNTLGHLLKHTPLPPTDHCGYQLDNMFFRNLFSLSCAHKACVRVSSTIRGCPKGQREGKPSHEARKVTLYLPLYCLFSALGQMLSSPLSVSFDGQWEYFR